MTRVLLADDHEMFRTGLRRLIDSEKDMKVVGEACNGTEAIKLSRDLNPDVILMDYDMPGIDGIEATSKISSIENSPHIIILTTYDSEEIAIRFIKAGASGFVPKKSSYDELLFAVKKVMSGAKYFTTSMSGPSVVNKHIDQNIKEVLSDREIEVFLLLANGLSLNEISNKTQLAYNTVRTYKSRLMEKLGFKNLNELVRYAVSKSLVDKY